MDWTAPIDNYCERLDPSFWAEPLNAVSNASFIIAGLLLLYQWQRHPQRPVAGLLLSLNVLLIGIGSFLFHTLANRWSGLADVVPIAIFIHVYLALALRTYLGLAWWQAIVAVLAFLAASPFIGYAAAPLIGSSASYVPALLAIFGVGAAAHRTSRETSNALFLTGGVFTISIAFRVADMPLCAALPFGTHLMWHTLNGVVLYLLVSLYLKVTAAPAAR